MMEDHSDSFYPGEEFVFITTKPEEPPVPRSEADPHKSDNTQAETFEKDPFVAILGWDSSDTTSLSAVSPDRVRNPGKDPDIPDCSCLHQSKILSFLVHNTITFVARFMADYGEYGSMMVDVGHADTLLATDFAFTKTLASSTSTEVRTRTSVCCPATSWRPRPPSTARAPAGASWTTAGLVLTPSAGPTRRWTCTESCTSLR